MLRMAFEAKKRMDGMEEKQARIKNAVACHMQLMLFDSERVELARSIEPLCRINLQCIDPEFTSVPWFIRTRQRNEH